MTRINKCFRFATLILSIGGFCQPLTLFSADSISFNSHTDTYIGIGVGYTHSSLDYLSLPNTRAPNESVDNLDGEGYREDGYLFNLKIISDRYIPSLLSSKIDRIFCSVSYYSLDMLFGEVKWDLGYFRNNLHGFNLLTGVHKDIFKSYSSSFEPYVAGCIGFRREVAEENDFMYNEDHYPHLSDPILAMGDGSSNSGLIFGVGMGVYIYPQNTSDRFRLGFLLIQGPRAEELSRSADSFDQGLRISMKLQYEFSLTGVFDQ